MSIFKFQVFKEKNSLFETQCIGDAKVVLEAVDKPENKKAIFRLYTVNSKGELGECWEGTAYSVIRFIKGVVLPLEKLMTEKMEKEKKIAKVTKAIFGTDEDK